MVGSVVEHDQFISGDGVRLAGTLARPSGKRRVPGVVLLSGSGAHDRDETVCGHRPFRTIAGFLARRGHAVLRYDDRGVGGSSGDSGSTDFSASVADARAAFRSLASTAGVVGDRIVLLGHSEGGLVAAAAASALPVLSVVLLAGPAVPIDSLLHGQARALSVEAGATARQIAHEQRMNEAVFEMVRAPTASGDALSGVRETVRQFLQGWPDVPPFDVETVAASAEEMARTVCGAAFRSLLRQSPGEILAAVKAPMLALYGGRDVQVPGPGNLEGFRRATEGNPRAEARLFGEMNHLFQRARTGFISEYETLPAGPADEVLEAVASWLERPRR
jgi:pimeloyl-ACP methyl ester carboxylesterase